MVFNQFKYSKMFHPNDAILSYLSQYTDLISGYPGKQLIDQVLKATELPLAIKNLKISASLRKHIDRRQPSEYLVPSVFIKKM